MNNPLRKIRWFADWLDERESNRNLRALRESYGLQLIKAKDKKDWDEWNQLNSKWGTERHLVLDPILARKGDRLVAKARKYNITVPDPPTDDSIAIPASLALSSFVRHHRRAIK